MESANGLLGDLLVHVKNESKDINNDMENNGAGNVIWGCLDVCKLHLRFPFICRRLVHFLPGATLSRAFNLPSPYFPPESKFKF